MQWTDIFDIVMALEERHQSADILSLRFTDLKKMVLEIPEFQGSPDRSNEKILEAIQMTWLKERS